MNLWQTVFSTAKNDDSQAKDPSVLNLRIGDTVSHDLIDYLVTGQLTYYSDSGQTWTDYQLEGDGDTWLVFEKESDLAAIYKSMDLDLDGKPPREMKYHGTAYYLCDKGRAGIIEANGQRVNYNGSLLRYWQYQDKTGGYVIYVEDHGGSLKISSGYYIRPAEIRLIRKLRVIRPFR